MSFQDLFGASFGDQGWDGALYHKIPFESYTEDWQTSTMQIGYPGWNYFFFLFFHPDGDLCGVPMTGQSAGQLVKAPPPSFAYTHQQDWVDGATLVAVLNSVPNLFLDSFDFLFFDPGGTLYGVTGDNLYSGQLQSNPQGPWLDSAKLLGTSGWSSYNSLFFDPEGILYGLKNGKLHKRTPPTDPTDDWLGTSKLIGTTGWGDIRFLFFMSNGELYAVPEEGKNLQKKSLYKGLSPTQGTSFDKWLASSSTTLIAKDGFDTMQFLMSPIKARGHSKMEDRNPTSFIESESKLQGVVQLKTEEKVPVSTIDRGNHHERKAQLKMDVKRAVANIPDDSNQDKSSSLYNSLASAVGYAGRYIKDKTKTYLQKHTKLSVLLAVVVAVVAGLVMALYPHSRSKLPDSLNLSAFPRTLVQGEKDPTDYDFGVRMDVQVQDCTSDTHWKKTFPDLDYSLLGYDILYGYPLANGRDPGFRHPIFSANYSQPKQTSDCRYVVPQGFTVIPSESCVVSFESKLVRNKQEMSEHLGVQAKVEGGGWGFEFSASTSYNKDTSEMSTGEFLYVMSQAECQNYYSMVDLKNPPPFDPGFLTSADKLVDAEDKDVLEFIEYYGTHFFTDVTFGAKFVQKHKISQTAYQSLKKSKIQVEVQASYSGLFSIGGGFSLDKEQSEAASNFSKAVETTTFTVGSTPPANGDAMTWAASVQQNPVPMLYSLSEIDNLFTGQFTQHLTPGVNYEAVREKLSNVSQKYCQLLKQNGTVHSCESKFHLEAAYIDITGRGYRYLREVDKSLCISFCLQDPNCTAVTYSVHKPPHSSSLCKFYSTVDENVNVHLNLTKRNGSDGILSDLVLFISKLQDVHLTHAKLVPESNAYFSESMDQSNCNSTCTEDLFCDAFSFSYNGTCSMYSTRDITTISVEEDSEVTFIGLHSN